MCPLFLSKRISVSYNGSMIDLHVHLDGSLTREELYRLALLSGLDPNEAKTAHISVDGNCTSLEEYLRCFDYPAKVLQKEVCIEEAFYMLSSRLARSGLLYAEIRFAPQHHIKGGLNQGEVVASAIRGIERTKKEYAFPCNIILCAMRGKGNEKENLETVEMAKDFYNQGVVGLDLAGAESLYPTKDFAYVFQKANEYGIPFTIHAGESEGPSSVWEAVRFGAARIGHGVRAVEDRSLLSFLAATGIVLELCPSSERDTHAISSYEALPIKELLKAGVKVCLNSDDMTVSNITLQEECLKVQKTFDFSSETMKMFYFTSVEAAFLDREQKDFLREQLEKRYER